MNIRSITGFTDIAYPLDATTIAQMGKVISVTRDALTGVGFTVQTTRLATQPLAKITAAAQALALASTLQDASQSNRFDYIALGPVRLEDPEDYLTAVPGILGGTETVFTAIEIADRENGIGLQRIRATAEIIRRVADLSSDGFNNLRLAALANVEPWSPFFPAAHHGGGAGRIAIATEGADLAVNAVGQASSLQEARHNLIQAIELQAQRVEAIISRTLANTGLAFQGIDFSLAPYPEDARSIGVALERLGVPTLGQAGSLMAAAFLTDTLDRAQFTRTGFCGLMLPVLEDSRLALRAAQGALQVSDLLAYSAVCGTGLDTIPLPGDIDPQRLAASLMDVAALALRLDKPLTARFMPLPGKRAGDQVIFNFEYFADSRVMDIPGDALFGMLAQAERADIQPRPIKPGVSRASWH